MVVVGEGGCYITAGSLLSPPSSPPGRGRSHDQAGMQMKGKVCGGGIVPALSSGRNNKDAAKALGGGAPR